MEQRYANEINGDGLLVPGNIMNMTSVTFFRFPFIKPFLLSFFVLAIIIGFINIIELKPYHFCTIFY